EASDPAYTAAFHSYGLPLTLDPPEAARRIVASAIREQLLAALDDWIFVKLTADPAGQKRLLTIARLADDDPWRRQFRDLKVWKNREELEQLAASPEVSAQPPATVILLGACLIAHDAVPTAVDLLREAQQRHPGDFWINVELSISLSKMKPPRDDEALSFD